MTDPQRNAMYKNNEEIAHKRKVQVSCMNIPGKQFGVLLAIAAMIMVLVWVSGTGEGETITVDDDGEGDYTAIQHAIDNATDGDNIVVFPGTYNESIEIGKSISIEGTGANETIIRGLKGTDTVTILSDNVALRNLTFNRGYWSSSKMEVRIEGDGVEVSGVTISRSGYGIYLSHADRNLLFRNTISDQAHAGIYLYHSDDNSIYDNVIIESNYGVNLFGSRDNRIQNNVLTENNQNGILLDESNRNTVEENMCSDSSYGIYITESLKNLVVRNVCSSNDYGITIYNCDAPPDAYSPYPRNNTLEENYANDNRRNGIRIYYSWDIDVLNNSCRDTTEDGIHIYNSYRIRVLDNALISNEIGVHHIFINEDRLNNNNNTYGGNTFADNDFELVEEYEGYKYGSDYDGFDSDFPMFIFFVIYLGMYPAIALFAWWMDSRKAPPKGVGYREIRKGVHHYYALQPAVRPYPPQSRYLPLHQIPPPYQNPPWSKHIPEYQNAPPSQYPPGLQHPPHSPDHSSPKKRPPPKKAQTDLDDAPPDIKSEPEETVPNE